MYKLNYPLLGDTKASSVQYLERNMSIPFAPGNTDYANFKEEILADQAQLQDAEGNLMSPEAAKEYVRSLP